MLLRFFLVMIVALFSTTAMADEGHDAALSKFLGNYGNVTMPLPWNANDETVVQRWQRVEMIADVVARQAPVSAAELGWYWSSDDLAIAAFTKMWYESGRFRLSVHKGTYRGDHGKSYCLGQIMFGGKRLVGTDRDSTRRCVTEVMRHLITHQRRCLNTNTAPSPWAIAKVFAGYGTGYSCKESSWMPVVDNHGLTQKHFWARERSYTWWQMRKSSISASVHVAIVPLVQR